MLKYFWRGSNGKKEDYNEKESAIERNKARNAMMLNDAELSDVSVELCYNFFMLRQTERGNSELDWH